jgi:hypothetical protein
MEILVGVSGGLPVLAHEVGEAAFRRAVGGRLTTEAAMAAMHDAAEIVGRKHLQPQVFETIRSTRYRSILGRIAGSGMSFERKAVLAGLSPEEGRVFDNFLRRMAKLGVVEQAIEKGPGAYRFKNLLHYVYIRMKFPSREKGGGTTAHADL